jgi:AbrB family looped-hinge helix DNA binding protein
MEVSIDRAGRIVVPKSLRDALHLKTGTRLEIRQEDGQLVLAPRPVPMRLVRKGKGLVVEPGKPLPALRTSQVRAVLESGRR